jgi:hypothetical protein
VISRNENPRYSQNYDKNRFWPVLENGQKSLEIVMDELRHSYPNHDIKQFSDRDKAMHENPSNVIKLFSSSDIVIGFHGAGLANTMYMKPGGVVVEVLPYIDSRQVPIIGIFARLSGIIGLNHYSYSIAPPLRLEPSLLVQEIKEFHDAILKL